MSDTKSGPRNATIDDVIEALKAELEFEQAQPDHEKHFGMGDWLWVAADKQDLHNKDQEPTWCKTAGCIAGTAAITQARLAHEPLFRWSEYDQQWMLRDDFLELAIGSFQVQEILGFKGDEAEAFFYRENWPSTYLDHATPPSEFNQDLVDAIKLLELKRDGRLTVDRRDYVDGCHYEWTIDGEIYSSKYY